MTRRRSTVLIVTFLVLVPVALWLFAARIISVVIPTLFKGDVVRIASIEVSTIGWRSAEIRRVKGISLTPAGAVFFDIENAALDYGLLQLEPQAIRIESARLDVRPIRAAETTEYDTVFALPAPISVTELHLIYDDAYEFKGRLELTGSEESFVVDAFDESSHLTIRGDATLSTFHVSLADANDQRVGAGRVQLDSFAVASFEADVQLGAALALVQNLGLVPPEYAAPVAAVDSVSGALRIDASRDADSRWAMQADFELERLATRWFSASASLAGSLRSGRRDWTFTLSRGGEIVLTTVDDLITDIYSVKFDASSGYSVSQFEAADGGATLSGSGAAEIDFYRSNTLDLNARVGSWSLRDWDQARVELQSLEITYPTEIRVEALEANVSAGNAPDTGLSGDAILHGIRTRGWPEHIAPAQIRGVWTWKDGAIESSGTARLGVPPDVAWTLARSDGRGALRVEVNEQLPALMKPFKRHLQKQGHDLELLGGVVKGQLEWVWDVERYSNRLALTADAVRGRIMGLSFDNAKFGVTSSDLVAPVFKLDGASPSVKLANGVEVSDVAFGGRWQAGFHLDKARFSVLGGQVKINPVFLDPGAAVLSAELEVSEIDLAQVMKMIDQEGLDGSGRLSGIVPLALKDSAIAVNNGRLRNTSLGHIGYDPGEETPVKLDNIALEALKDFRYDLLDATLNYEFEGHYSIRARIEGRNPSLYDGYPVAFNLNLVGQLPGLIRASLITGDFSKEILKEIKQRQ